MKTKITFTALAMMAIILFGNPMLASTIHSTTVGGEWDDESTWIGGIIPGQNDTAVINGPVTVGYVDGYSTYDSYGGWVIVEASGSLMPHKYGGGLGTFILHVDHDFVNRGTLTNGTGPDTYEHLQLNIAGNIENYGSWRCQKTQLTGQDQQLTLGDGNTFGGFWECLVPDDIYAGSDLKFDCLYYTYFWNLGEFNLHGSTLHMGNYGLDATGTLIYNGTVEGDFYINGRFAVNKSPSDTLRFVGNITVSDTLQNNEYGGGLGIQNLLIEGNLTNNGVIRDNNDLKNDDRLSILITGDIVNNGHWSCYYVKMVGEQEQSITQANGMVFDSYFSDLDSNSSIRANSDITVLQDFNLGRSTLYMENKMLQVGGWLHNGMLHNTKLHGGYLQYLDCMGGLEVYGRVIIDDSISFEGSVSIYDTLMPNTYGGGAKKYPLDIQGSVINHGVIMNNGGESLILHISGNITNNGEWINYLTTVYVTNEQYIELIDDKAIEGTVKFDALIQSETYQWYYNDAILDSEDFEGETSQVLEWLVPVSSDWYGSFTCETGTKESVGILIKKGNLGIEDPMQEIDFAVFPNPCRDELSIRHSAPGTRHSELRILDIAGRTVCEYENTGSREDEIIVDVSHLPAGLYLVKLQTEDGVGVRKIIKQ